MAFSLSGIINKLNQPIGGNQNVSEKKLEKNKNIEVMEISSADAIKNVQIVRYKYKVRDKDGFITKGKLDALSKLDVHSFLITQGYDVLEITDDKLFNKLGLSKIFNRQMRDKDLSFFLTQLSTYIKAGLPLIDSIKILERQSKKKSRQALFNRIVFELNSGVSLSDALARQGTIFPKLLINMVKTSELTGDLTGVLDDMSAYYKTSDENRKQIISALTYPSVIFVVAIAVLIYIMLYVVPQFTQMYTDLGSELPLITLVVSGVSNFLANNIMYIFLVFLSLFFIIYVLYKNVRIFRYWLQWFFMHIPVLKNIIMYNEMIMFTKTFASLINYDVFITDSMEILGKITNNEIYKNLIRNSVVNLSNGNGISIAFRNQWAFPDVAYEMLVTGERTGRLGPMMDNVSEYYSNEQKNLISQLKSLIEPITILLLAFAVGVILLSVIVPMFRMYEEFL